MRFLFRFSAFASSSFSRERRSCAEEGATQGERGGRGEGGKESERGR